METLETFPSIADIRKISEEHLLFTREARLIIEDQCDCKKCSSGIVVMHHRKNQSKWTFSCDCKNGKSQYSYARYVYKMKMAKWKKDPSKEEPHFMAPPVLWGLQNGYQLEGEEQNSERISPWPASIEGIMLQIQDGRSTKYPEKFQTSLNFTRLSEDQAWRLYQDFAEKNFSSKNAEMILAGRKDSQVLARLRS